MNKQPEEQNDWRDLLKKTQKKEEKNVGGKFLGIKKFRFSLWYLLLAVVLISALNMMFFRSKNQDIPYSQFKGLIREGQIKEIRYLGNNLEGYASAQSEGSNNGDVNKNYFQQLLQASTATSDSWKTVRIPDDPTLLPLMEEMGIVFLAVAERNNYLLDILIRMVLPIALLLLVLRYLMKRMGGLGGSNVMSFGQNNAKIVAEDDLQTRFNDIAGCDEAKDELMEIVDFLKNPMKYTNIGGRIPKGALLVGPPGTGKTLLARAVSGEAEVTFFRMSGADFVEMFVGVGAARVRDLFKQAREKAPCIIFIDELDAIGKSRAGTLSTNDEREQTLNQLLVEMDGFDSTSGVIILAATNRPEVLDPALLRPGRFDRQVVVEKPDLIGREAILKIHAKPVQVDENVDLSDIAKATAGLAGADLANIVNEAALLAVRMGHEKVSNEDFFEAVEKAAIGLKKTNKMINPHEREVIAYHETGHALVNIFTPDQHKVKKITIVPRGYGIMGYMLPVPEEERAFQTKEELLGLIDVALAGRAAEEIIYSSISTGAGNDLMRATEIARAMIARLGMSKRFANVSFDQHGRGFLNNEQPYHQGREYAESTQSYIDEEIARIMAERYAHVKSLLDKHRVLLESIASRLLDEETLEHKELMEIITNDKNGAAELVNREKADLKPSLRAQESGEARNEVIKNRLAERRAAEKETARKKEEEIARKKEESQSPPKNEDLDPR